MKIAGPIGILGMLILSSCTSYQKIPDTTSSENTNINEVEEPITETVVDEPPILEEEAKDQWELLGEETVFPFTSHYKLDAIIDDKGIVYCVFAEKKTFKLHIYRLVNNKWEVMSGVGLENHSSSEPILGLDDMNNLYLAFNASDYGAVLKFAGDKWEQVGSNFCKGEALDVKISFDQENTPYICYAESSDLARPKVKMFDGSKWATVGTKKFEIAGMIKGFAVDNLSRPVIAIEFVDSKMNQNSFVYRFENSAWNQLGDIDFYDCIVSKHLITNEKNEIIFVHDGGAENSKTKVYKYSDAGNWQELGAPLTESSGKGAGLGYDSANRLTIVYGDLVGSAFVQSATYVDGKWQKLESSVCLALEGYSFYKVVIGVDGVAYAVCMDYPGKTKFRVYKLVRG